MSVERIIVSTTNDAIYTGGDPALDGIEAAIDAGQVIRISHSDDREYEISVIEYTTPDTGETRWAYRTSDPAESEIRDFQTREEAEAYYEKDVRGMLNIGWVLHTCDVEGIHN